MDRARAEERVTNVSRSSARKIREGEIIDTPHLHRWPKGYPSRHQVDEKGAASCGLSSLWAGELRVRPRTAFGFLWLDLKY